MKKWSGSLIFFGMCLLFFGCQQASDINNNVKEEEIISEIDLFDFKNFGKAPQSTETHPIHDVVTIYFSEWTFDHIYKPIAINIKNNEMYLHPSLSLHRFSTYDEVIQINNSKEIINMLERYEVQSWKSDYTYQQINTYQDGYSWKLWLQYEDGSVERHGGNGTDKEKLTPDNFSNFAAALYQFVDERLAEVAGK